MSTNYDTRGSLWKVVLFESDLRYHPPQRRRVEFLVFDEDIRVVRKKARNYVKAGKRAGKERDYQEIYLSGLPYPVLEVKEFFNPRMKPRLLR